VSSQRTDALNKGLTCLAQAQEHDSQDGDGLSLLESAAPGEASLMSFTIHWCLVGVIVQNQQVARQFHIIRSGTAFQDSR
jgi:hypothetical protein